MSTEDLWPAEYWGAQFELQEQTLSWKDSGACSSEEVDKVMTASGHSHVRPDGFFTQKRYQHVPPWSS